MPESGEQLSLARHLPLGDGIVITEDDHSTLGARNPEFEDSDLPAQWLPSNRAAQECLTLQAMAVPLSPVGRIFGVDVLAPAARRSYSGALAEIELAESFPALGVEWTILHSVPIDDDGQRQYSVVDHLLIGPAGIFTITVRSHSGQNIWVGERTFLVDGERLTHFDVAEKVASAATQLLNAVLLTSGTEVDVVVTPCVAVDSPATLQIRQHAGRTRVSTARNVIPWLTSLPRLYSPAVVDALSAAALQRSTWPAQPRRSVSDMHRQREDFDLLRHRVASARLRRLIWAGIGIIASYTAVIANLTGLTASELTAALGS